MMQAMRLGRRIGIAIAGGLVVLIGVVLAVPLIPGPGLLVVLLGLAILSLEFERPREWLAWLKARMGKLKHSAQLRLKARSAARRRDAGHP
jgi:uncharacterized protein (TIGR02611 family)